MSGSGQHAVFPEQASRSAGLFARAGKVMPGGGTRHPIIFPPHPVYAVEGRGCRLTDVDGVERIDFINNFSCQIHGHGHPEVTRVITEQAGRLTTAILPTEQELRLAELLAERVAGIDQVRFCNSGTEAVMIALKAARAATRRRLIMKMEGGYHGQYPEMECSFISEPHNWGPEEEPAKVPLSEDTPANLFDNVVVAPFNRVEATRALIRRHAAELAAVIIDPFPSRMQFVRAGEEYLRMLREETRAAGALLIFDEVFCFRLDYRGAQGRFGVTPDLTTLGKIIGGGLPIGAVGGRAEVMAVFSARGAGALPRVFHGGTFTANPMSMAAGLRSMQLLTPAAFADLQAKGDRLRSGLRDAAAASGLPVQVMGDASLTGIALSARPFDGYRDMITACGGNHRERMFALHRHLLNEGVLISPQGALAGSTPMTDSDIDFTVEAAGRAFAALARDDAPDRARAAE
jgi:glutamate-1-semialdehyde 2,1-aminomutase